MAALTQSHLDKVIDDLNEKVHGSARITSWKRRAVTNICLHMPSNVYDILYAHYLTYTWERSLLSEELLQDSLWRLGSKVPKSKGEWQTIYTMTADVLEEIISCLVRRWERQWPWEMAKSAPLRDLQSSRPTRMEDDDESVFVRTAASTCFYLKWLIPKVEAEFGKDGVTSVDDMWRRDDPGLQQDLCVAIACRADTESSKLLTLGSLKNVHASLWRQRPHDGTALERADNATQIAKKWDDMKGRIERDLAVFKSALKDIETAKSREYIHMLQDVRRIASSGDGAVRDFQRVFHHTADSASWPAATLLLSNFVRQVAGSTSCTADSIPILCIWNLNSLGSAKDDEDHGWQPIADALGQMLQGRPNTTMGVILHKRACTHSTRRAFHNRVAMYMEKAHVNLDTDLSLTYTRSHRNNRESLTNHGWLAFVGDTSGQPLATNPWASSQLVLAGSVQNLEQARLADRITPRAPATIPFEGGEGTNSLSSKARSQTTSEDTYKRIVEEALADLPATGSKNKLGLPVVVVVLLDPYDSKASMALLKMQMATKGRSHGPEPHFPVDLYVLALPSTTVTKQVTLHAVSTHVYQQWFNKMYTIEGHARPTPQTWSGDYPSNPPDMEVASTTSDGFFSVPNASVKQFLEAEGTCMEAHRYLAALEAQKPTLKWTREERGRLSAPPSLREAEPAPTTEPTSGGITSVDDLTAAGLLADVPSTNGALRILVTRDFKFYVHVVTATSVTQGDRLCQMGSGGRKDEEEANQAKAQGKLVIPIRLENDASHVCFQRSGAATDQLFTFYGLHSQLTLEGIRSIGLNYHTFEPVTGGSGAVERFQMRVARQKYWVTRRVRGAAEVEGQSTSYDTSNVGCLMSLADVPNRFIKARLVFLSAHSLSRTHTPSPHLEPNSPSQVIWHLVEERRDGGFWLQFERPAVVWSNTMQLQAGSLFRVA